MATRRKARKATPGRKPAAASAVKRALAERDEALKFQAATAEILASIRNSVSDAKPVFDAIVRNVVRLFGTQYATVFLVKGDMLELAGVDVATVRARTAAAAEARKRFWQSFPQPIEPGSLTGKAIRTGKVQQLSRILGNPRASARARQLAKTFAYNAMAVTPLVRDGVVIGAISTTHPEARRFSAKELALLRTFADQAVIAIENARLFNETKEALERQTSISEVLAVISSSPTDLAPILDAVASRAAKLCDATDARIFLVDGSQVRHAAGFGDLPVKTDAFPAGRGTSVGTAIMDGRVVHVRDIEDEGERYPLSRDIARKAGWRTTLNVPLMRENRALGAISLRRQEVRPFTDRQAALLKVFADQAAIAIENTRLFNETTQALERQMATSEILKVIARSPTNVQPVLDTVAENAGRLCGVPQVTVLLKEGDLLRTRATYSSDDGPTPPPTHAFPVRRTYVTGRALLEARTVHLEDVSTLLDSEFPDARGNQETYGFRGVLAVPMIRNGQGIGVLYAWRREPGLFVADQVALLETFADQAVIAIENARLFNETKEALEKQTATADILQVLSGSPSDTQPVFDAIVRHATRLCESTYANVFRYDGGRLHLAASEGVPEDVLESLKRDYPMAPDRSRVVGRVIQDARVVRVEDTHADPDYDKVYAGALGHRRILGVPLLRGGRPLGAIAVAWTQPGPILPRHEDLLKTFADQAVIAIENVRLFNETEEALERQTATADVLSAISGSPTDVAPVHGAILQNATRLCEASFAAVFLYDGEYLRAAAHLGASPAFANYLDETRLRPSRETATRRAALEKRVVQVEDLLNDPEFAPARAHRAENARTVLSVPMLREGALVGLITVWRREPRRFNDQQVGLLKTFADQAVIAIENVRLFNETKEALERQTATAEILRVIGGSMTDTQPVFDAIVQKCGNLFAQSQVALWLIDGGHLHVRASTGESMGSQPIDRESALGVCVLDGRNLHLPDLEEAAKEMPRIRTLGIRLGMRSGIYAPLLHRGRAVGGISVLRREAGAFQEKELALLNTFADQAVIAIQNAQLFNETREALEQQTATAEVLKVISSSPTDVAPVFDAILRSAVTLCGAELAAVFPFDGKLVHLGATHNWPPAALEYFSKVYPSPPSPKLLSGRTILAKSIVQIVDSAVDEHYDPASVASGHWRRMLGAPMLREGTPLGALVVAWREPGETPPRQVELLQTFADQAAIAIENVRLFNETKEALDQQKASAEVLGAISGSIADTKPVFEKILSSCERLFEGELVGITLADGDTVRLAAYHGPQGEQLKTVYPLPLTRESGTGWAILNAEIAHFPDIEAKGVPPGVVAGCRTLKVRAIVFAPMLFEGKGIGAIWVARAQVGAFTEKQIAQLRTFADQAVIAIQNARLFREIQEKSAQLEVANKHKSDFLANMSHELRTPLNAIIGFSEVLSERMFGEVNEKQAEYLKDIHESGRHLLSLINDILDLSKIEAGRMELELSSFDLPSAVSNAMTLVRERAQRHGIALGLEMEPGLGELEADERKVKQILLNLLSNAVKFTPDGGKVDVCARKADGKIEIAVRDTGIGIAPEDHAAVFEEFKQVGRDYTRKAEGTGLGLALTKRLVELHGGEIALESAPGKGSTFTVRLPVR